MRSWKRVLTAVHLTSALGSPWSAAVLICVAPLQVAAESTRYFILDGRTYLPEQLREAVRSPIQAKEPTYQAGEYVVHRSPDGQFYVPGSVNGYPVVWMVDTGATYASIPAQEARNAGIRVGLATQFQTAGGKTVAGVSDNNELRVGPFRLRGVKVGMSAKLTQHLLGASALERLHITQDGNTLVLRLLR